MNSTDKRNSDETSPINYHINNNYEVINFSNIYENLTLYRIPTDGDGNCFFHAICSAYFIPYISQTLHGEPLDRRSFVSDLRRDLANKLSERTPHSKKSYYRRLANGELKNLSESLPECSLSNMQKELSTSGLPVSHLYNEFISDILDIDIYILDYEKKDVYMTGTDFNLLYKNRKSIIILYLPGHYELIGHLSSNSGNENKLQTCFKPDHSVIVKIRNRILQLQK